MDGKSMNISFTILPIRLFIFDIPISNNPVIKTTTAVIAIAISTADTDFVIRAITDTTTRTNNMSGKCCFIACLLSVQISRMK